jgi:hypothetical protein
LRATTRFSGVLIRAQCGAGAVASGFSVYAPDVSFWLSGLDPVQAARLFEAGSGDVFVASSK